MRSYIHRIDSMYISQVPFLKPNTNTTEDIVPTHLTYQNHPTVWHISWPSYNSHSKKKRTQKNNKCSKISRSNFKFCTALHIFENNNIGCFIHLVCVITRAAKNAPLKASKKALFHCCTSTSKVYPIAYPWCAATASYTFGHSQKWH